MKKRFVSLIGAVAALSMLTSCGAAPLATYERTSVERKTVVTVAAVGTPSGVEGMTAVATVGYCTMYADTATGFFAIEDLRTGKIFRSNPPLETEDVYAQDIYRNWLFSQVIISTADPESGSVSSDNSYVAVLKKDEQKVDILDDGIRVTYHFLKKDITLAVDYRLLEDGFYASVDTGSIVENGTEYLNNIKLLPMFGAASLDESGFLLVPDGSGAMIRFGDKRAWEAQPYRVHIYGNDAMLVAESDSNNAETVTLPMAGLADTSGGFLAVADQGASYAYVNASASRQMTGYNMAFFDYDVRLNENAVIGDIRSWNYRKVVSYETTPIAVGTISARYILLDGTQNSLVGMADVFRQYLLNERQAAVKISQTPSLYLRVLCGTKKQESVLGVPVSRKLAVTTADSATDMVASLEQSGIPSVKLCLDNWSNDQLAGRLTTDMDFVSSFGTAKEWNALAESLKASGGGLYLNTALARFTESGGGYSKNRSVIRDINGAIIELLRYRRDVYYPDASGITDRLLKARYCAQALNDFVQSAKKVPDCGILLSDLGTQLGSDYGDDGLRRDDAAQCLASAVATASAETDLIGEASHYYVLKNMNALLSTADSASVYPAVSEPVPFLQLVLRGVMDVVSRPINASGSSQQAFLYCIATGQIPSYEVATDIPSTWKNTDVDGYYAADVAAWQDTVSQQYKAFSEVFTATKGSTVTDLRIMDGGVYVTDYQNGVRTVVNTGAAPVTVDGMTVPASDFVLLQGGAK